MRKFFISYTAKDSQKAQWIGWTLTDLGHQAFVHEWEIGAGQSIADWMESKVEESDHLIGVFSPDYITAVHSKSERHAAGWNDPIGRVGSFMPVVVRPCELPRMVQPLKRLDLTGCDRDEARLKLETFITPPTAPESEPQFEEVPTSGHATEPEPQFEPTVADYREALKIPRVATHATVSSTVFFSDRFAQAFPGTRGIEWFTDTGEIQRRIMKLMEQPLAIGSARPIWWWRDGDMHIERFDYLEDGLYLMDVYELKISKIAASHSNSYFRSFVYVEAEKMPATGLYPNVEQTIQRDMEHRGYCLEEYGLYNGRIPISRNEYDDGAAMIDGNLVNVRNNAELRVRYLTPYNFVIASYDSPINNSEFDSVLANILNAVLLDQNKLLGLVAAVRRLPKRSQ